MGCPATLHSYAMELETPLRCGERDWVRILKQSCKLELHDTVLVSYKTCGLRHQTACQIGQYHYPKI